MKIQIISDIHLEHRDDKHILSYIIPSADILVIAGDLCNIRKVSIDIIHDSLKILSLCYERIYYVPGNHEYFNRLLMPDIKLELQKICSSFDNVIFLDNNIDEYNGYVFIGSILWSLPLEDEYTEILNRCNNKKQMTIRKGVKISIESMIHDFKSNLSWIEHEISKCDKKVVLITHYLPSYSAISEKYKESSYNSMFATDLEYLFESPLVLWIAGHTHFKKHVNINGIPLIVNPLGYTDEFSGYDKQCIVDV
jgi:Icc-related predicted phosphoesterase